MIDHAALAPALSEEQVSQACETAKRYQVGRFTVRPSDVDAVAGWMRGSNTVVGTVVGYPTGFETTAVKLYAVRDALQRGAKAIETVLNHGKLASRQFRFLESELIQMAQECRRANAELIVGLQPGLPEDLRVIACKIARRADVHWVRAASLDDVAFLTQRLGDNVQLDAGVSVGTLDEALRVHEMGCSGFQTGDPAPILEAWTAELKSRAEAAKPTT